MQRRKTYLLSFWGRSVSSSKACCSGVVGAAFLPSLSADFRETALRKILLILSRKGEGYGCLRSDVFQALIEELVASLFNSCFSRRRIRTGVLANSTKMSHDSTISRPRGLYLRESFSQMHFGTWLLGKGPTACGIFPYMLPPILAKKELTKLNPTRKYTIYKSLYHK